MKTEELRTRLNRGLLKAGVDVSTRRKLVEGRWKAVVEIGKAFDDETIDTVLAEVFPESVLPIIGPALKHRGHWLTRQEPVNPEAVLVRTQVIAQQIGAVLPEEVVVVGPGAPRPLVGKEPDLHWINLLRSLNTEMNQDPALSQFDCRLVNAVVQHVHEESGRLVRMYFVAAFLGALRGQPQPWDLIWQLCLDGILLEAMYTDGTVQVASRDMSAPLY